MAFKLQSSEPSWNVVSAAFPYVAPLIAVFAKWASTAKVPYQAVSVVFWEELCIDVEADNPESRTIARIEQRCNLDLVVSRRHGGGAHTAIDIGLHQLQRMTLLLKLSISKSLNSTGAGHALCFCFCICFCCALEECDGSRSGIGSEGLCE